MIGYYGGGFDPVHNGHIGVARFILSFPEVDEICFVPVADHPFEKKMCAFRDRLAMLKIATAGIDGFRVSDIEERRSGSEPPYTINLLTHLKQTTTEPFFFIAGLDNFNEITAWRDWKRLLTSFPIVFTSRAATVTKASIEARAVELTGHSLQMVERLDFPIASPVFLKVPDFNISSTAVRKMILNKEQPFDIINPGVLDYINKHKLYRKGGRWDC